MTGDDGEGQNIQTLLVDKIEVTKNGHNECGEDGEVPSTSARIRVVILNLWQ